jgi:hypothetical protein
MNCQNRLTAGAKFSSDAAEQWKNGLLPPLLFELQRQIVAWSPLRKRFAFVAGNDAVSSSIQLFNSREEMRPVFQRREGRGRSRDEAADYAFG